MNITRRETAQKLTDYLHHRIALADLVDWAENAMMDARLEEDGVETLREILGRIGLADVRAFGLTWEDCENFLARLGYKASVSVVAEASTTYGWESKEI